MTDDLGNDALNASPHYPLITRDTLVNFLSTVDSKGVSDNDLGESFWHIEGNYHREGSGPGSRFEGEMLTTVQARYARTHLIEAFADALLEHFDICARNIDPKMDQ